jgi:hypothetical protein
MNAVSENEMIVNNIKSDAYGHSHIYMLSCKCLCQGRGGGGQYFLEVKAAISVYAGVILSDMQRMPSQRLVLLPRSPSRH